MLCNCRIQLLAHARGFTFLPRATIRIFFIVIVVAEQLSNVIHFYASQKRVGVFAFSANGMAFPQRARLTASAFIVGDS